MSFRIDPGLPLADEVRRIVSQEAGAVHSVLSGMAEDRHRELHGARKRLKKLRGLLRLVRSGDEAFYRRENARYRDVAHSLAAARDAGALVETVDRFVAEASDEAVVRDLTAIREALVHRRDEMMRERAASDDAAPAAARSLREGLDALPGLTLPEGREASADVLAAGVERTLDKVAKSLKRARKRNDPEDFHELRKDVKYHWMHLGLVRDVWPGAVNKRRKAVKALGERLGELNDVAVMRDLLAAEGEAIAAPGRAATFHGLLDRKEKTLRKACLAEAKRLFDRPPKKRAAGVRKRYRKTPDRREAPDKPAPAEPALADA